MANLFCDVDESEYTQKNCGIDFAGIVAIGYIREDFDQSPDVTVADLEDEDWWSNRISASPKDAFIGTKGRGEYPKASPTEEDGFGRESSQVTGAAHEVTAEFEGMIENRDFVEFLNSRKWKVAFITNADIGYYVDVPVTVYGAANVPRGIDTGQFWMVSHKWKSLPNPVAFNIPSNIFDE